MSNTESEMNGLRLERFTANNADLVLSWRNARQVRENSLNDAEIARDAHLGFVAGLAGCDDRHFFVLYESGVPKAVLNVNQDADGTALWGCYLGGSGPVRPGLFPILIAVAGILAFDMLGCTRLKSEVLKNNTAPQSANSFLGVTQHGTRVETREDGTEIEVLLYEIAAENWPKIRERIDKVLTRHQREMVSNFAASPASNIV